MNIPIMTTKIFSVVLLFFAIFITSCRKDEGEGIKYRGDFGLKVNIEGVESSSSGGSNIDTKASVGLKSAYGTTLKAKQAVFAWGNTGLNIRATLSPVVDSAAVMKEYKTAALTRSSSSGLNKLAATSHSSELGDNIAYRVMAYDNTGAKVADRTYNYKRYEEDDDVNTGYENLVVGQTYTFVVYSVNTTVSADLNVLEDEVDLNTAKVNTDGSKALLYFKTDVTIALGVNFLNVRLKHKLSQVTTKITVDEGRYPTNGANLSGSRIYEIRNSYVSPTYSSAKLNLIDGSLSRGDGSSPGSSIVFPAIGAAGVNAIQSATTNIIANGEPSKFYIEGLTLNQLTNPVTLTQFPNPDTGTKEDFVLEPGVRYTLQFEIMGPCIADAVSPKEITVERFAGDIEDARTTTFTFENDVNYGVVFDIHHFDNSFNMKINGQHLYIGSVATTESSTPVPINELQFQGYRADGSPFPYAPNIEFEDGDRWQVSPLEHIWQYNGMTEDGATDYEGTPTGSILPLNQRKPVIRIVIGVNGVSILATKNIAGGEPFYPLHLLNEEYVTYRERTSSTTHESRTVYVRGKFNPNVSWNKSGTNTVEISQIPFSWTYMYGVVRGKKFVDCTPES